jgi:hypothetical protein
VPKPNTPEICRLHLFDGREELQKQAIQEMPAERIIRMRSAYTLRPEHPRKRDAEIRDRLLNFGVNKSQAYEDIQILKLLPGDMTGTSRAFHRFRFNSMIQNAYGVAERKRDARSSMAAAAAMMCEIQSAGQGRRI